MNTMDTIKYKGRITGNNIRHDWNRQKPGSTELVEVEVSTVEFNDRAPLVDYTQFQLIGFYKIGSEVEITVVINQELPTQKNEDYEDVVRQRDDLKKLVNDQELELEELRNQRKEISERVN